MFILSIIPVPISGDSNNKPVNLQNKVDTLEHTIMSLECLLTGEILGQISSIDQQGAFDPQTQMLLKKLESELKEQGEEINFSDQTFVKKIMNKKREELTSVHETNDDDAICRLKEIDFKDQVANIRLSDLNKLLEFRKEHPFDEFDVDPQTPGIQHISGLASDKDLNDINKEVERAEDYKKELADAKTFWDKISGFPSNVNK